MHETKRLMYKHLFVHGPFASIPYFNGVDQYSATIRLYGELSADMRDGFLADALLRFVGGAAYMRCHADLGV